MTNFFVSLIVFLLTIGTLVGAQVVCTCTDQSTGYVYDLSPLKSASDYVVTMGTATNQGFLNVCTQTITQTCGSGVAACQIWDVSNGGYASLGKLSTQALTTNGGGQGGYGVTAKFTDGTANRNFEIDFLCNPGSGKGSPVFTGESPSLHYNYKWETNVVCPADLPPTSDGGGSSGGLSGGSIFLILLLCVSCVYIIGGLAVNKLYRKTEGFVDTFPNWIFWVSLPSLVKDGCVFLVHKVRGQ